MSVAENAASFSLVAELMLPMDVLLLLSSSTVGVPVSLGPVSISSSCCLATGFFNLWLCGLHGRRDFSSLRTTPLGVSDSDSIFDLRLNRLFLLFVYRMTIFLAYSQLCSVCYTAPPPKVHLFILKNNSDKNEQILMISGMLNPEKI